MKHLLQRINRGESVILGYVLLIVLAIGMSAAVYAYLTFYLPKDQPHCPESVSLTISNLNCSKSQLTLTLTNRGLFSVNGSYIKMGEKDRTFKNLVNCPGPGQSPPKCQLYFNSGPAAYLTVPLKPGESWTRTFDLNFVPVSGRDYDVDVEPLIVVSSSVISGNKSKVLCADSVIRQPVKCE